MSSTDAWELIFLMLVLKLPIVYLIGVVLWAIRAKPQPEPASLVPVVPATEPPPCPWRLPRPRTTRPTVGRRHVAAARAVR